MKHVYDSRHVFHLWATLGAQENARYQSRSVFYSTRDGIRTLYSYRESYPIASTFSMGIGTEYKQIFLLRAGQPYSVTTAKHFNFSRHAAHGDYQFTVPCFEAPLSPEDHAYNIKHYHTVIQDACDKLDGTKIVRNVSWRLETLHQLYNEALKYCEVFGLTLGKTASCKKTFDADTLAKMQAREDELNRTKVARQAIRDAKIIAQWRAGEPVHLPYRGYSPYALLRIVGSNVQTSMGATVPILGHAGAARLFRFLKAIKDTGRTYQCNGHTEHIGQFTVDSFDGETLTAGCHKITWDEIAAIGEHVLRCEYNLQLEVKE